MEYYASFGHDLANKKIEIFTDEEYTIKYGSFVYVTEYYFHSFDPFSPYAITADSKEEAKHILRDAIENICTTSTSACCCKAEDLRSFLKNEIEDFDNKFKVVNSLRNECSCICMPKTANFKNYLFGGNVYVIPDSVISTTHPIKFAIDWHPATIEDYINTTDKSNIKKYAKIMYWHKRQLTEDLCKSNKMIEELQEKIKSLNNDLDLLENTINELPAEIRLPFELNINRE